MLFSRLSRARRGSADRLVVCEMCGADFVSQEIADRYDRALDRTSEPIVAALARLDGERMTHEVEAFATALRLDLFDAGDFARGGAPGGASER